MFEDQLRHSDKTELKRMQLRSAQLAEEIDRVAQDSHDFSLEFGQGGRMSAGERLELGRRLARTSQARRTRAAWSGALSRTPAHCAAKPSIVA